MIDPQLVRNQPEHVKACLDARHYPPEFLETYMKADREWRDVLQGVDELKAKRNQMTPKGKPTPELLAELTQLAEKIKQDQERLQILEQQTRDAALLLPNIFAEDVPAGKSEADNQEVRVVGVPKAFSFTPKAHDELATALDLVDFERAAKISGARFAVYKKWGAKLERALINFMLDLHTGSHGYTEIMPPALINSQSLTGTGQLPKFAADLFKAEESDLWLSPTAEVQLTNLYRNEILDEELLPMKLTAHTPCFRKEAGSYGKDVKGLIRQHQFNKIELVKLVDPASSADELEKLLNDAEAVLKALDLPYRVVKLCSGDLGFSSAKTYDIEVWFPSQNTYREISSCSNFLDFQARRSMIRYKDKTTGKVQYLHTINGSGLAVGRTFAAILENGQTEDGQILIPSVLQSDVGVEKLQ